MNASALLNDPTRAWAPYEPSAKAPWDLARVAHLHRRAGFAAPSSILQRDLKDGPSKAVDRLIEGEPTSGDGQSADEFDALLDEMATRIGSDATPARLQGLWLYRMILTARDPCRREDDAVLAQPFRHVAHQGREPRPDAAAERIAPRARTGSGKFRDDARRRRQGPGDARLARLAGQSQGEAERELRPRGHGTVHAGNWPLHGEGHPGVGPLAFTGWFVVRDRFQHAPPPSTTTA